MKKYQVRFTKRAAKALKKLENSTKVLLYTWINENLEGCTNPRSTGKALAGNLKGLWRYRVGDYRIVAEIRDGELLILVINVGNRKDVYR